MNKNTEKNNSIHSAKSRRGFAVAYLVWFTVKRWLFGESLYSSDTKYINSRIGKESWFFRGSHEKDNSIFLWFSKPSIFGRWPDFPKD